MAWMNYRKIQDRFRHIDAEFVRSDVSLSPQGSHASVTVRFYPWWEHPGYLKARETGTAWGFTRAVEAGRQNVTVKAVVPYAARISQRVEVTDWGFSEEHPLLWDFAQEVTIYVNGHFDVLHLTERVLDRHMPFVTRRDLERYFDPAWRPVPSRGILIPATALCEHCGKPHGDERSGTAWRSTADSQDDGVLARRRRLYRCGGFRCRCARVQARSRMVRSVCSKRGWLTRRAPDGTGARYACTSRSV